MKNILKKLKKKILIKMILNIYEMYLYSLLSNVAFLKLKNDNIFGFDIKKNNF